MPRRLIPLIGCALAALSLSACSLTSSTTTPTVENATPATFGPETPSGGPQTPSGGPQTPSGPTTPGAETPGGGATLPPASGDVVKDSGIVAPVPAIDKSINEVKLPESVGSLAKVAMETAAQAAYSDPQSGRTINVQLVEGASEPFAKSSKGLSAPATYGSGRVLIGQVQGIYRAFVKLTGKDYARVDLIGFHSQQDAAKIALEVVERM